MASTSFCLNIVTANTCRVDSMLIPPGLNSRLIWLEFVPWASSESQSLKIHNTFKSQGKKKKGGGLRFKILLSQLLYKYLNNFEKEKDTNHPFACHIMKLWSMHLVARPAAFTGQKQRDRLPLREQKVSLLSLKRRIPSLSWQGQIWAS